MSRAVVEGLSELDPIAFLRATPPFDQLAPADFARLTAALEIQFHPAGARLLQRGAPPLEHVLVIRKGAVRLERDGQTVDVLEEGDPVGITSLLLRTTPLDVVVDDDLLAYAIPRAAIEPLLARRELAEHFGMHLGERLKKSLERPSEAARAAELGRPVGQLATRALVTVAPTATVGEAARVMRAAGVSAVVVMTEPPGSRVEGRGATRNEAVGIVTDRDLRNRVLAEGRGPEVPVAAVMSAPLVTVDAALPLHDAWQVLLDGGMHHLPIVDAARAGQLVGMVTSTDLLRHGSDGPVGLLRAVEQLASRAELPGYGARLAALASGLLAGGLDTTVIAQLVSRLNDALVRRILRWAEADLGPAPCPWAWIVVGSEGRREQTLQSDQDHALVWADGVPDAAPWFLQVAERAVVDLEAAGFPRCPGDTMATRWHGPLATWRERFRGWIEEPTQVALVAAATFFDFRRVHGTLDLAPLDALIASARQRPILLRCLAKAALEHRPRTGLMLRLRGDASKVDLKREGLAAIVMLARAHALEVGATARGTLERLAAAHAAGLLDAETHAAMADSFGFLVRLRLREQLRRRERGEPASNEVTLGQLGATERRALRDALRAIRSWQDAAAYHYQTDLL